MCKGPSIVLKADMCVLFIHIILSGFNIIFLFLSSGGVFCEYKFGLKKSHLRMAVLFEGTFISVFSALGFSD